jgi:hypothetical protein
MHIAVQPRNILATHLINPIIKHDTYSLAVSRADSLLFLGYYMTLVKTDGNAGFSFCHTVLVISLNRK